MEQTAVEWLESEMLKPNLSMKEILKQAKEIEKQKLKAEKLAKEHFRKQRDEGLLEQSKMYSKEEVLPLLEMLEKCKEYFLLKTDAKSEERADAIGQSIEDFKKLKNK
jgi:hypothetical protein